MQTINNQTENSKKVLVNFHIGRGGRFNNQGYLTFHSVGDVIKNNLMGEYYIYPENHNDILRTLQNDDEKEEMYLNAITDLGSDWSTESAEYRKICAEFGEIGKPCVFDSNQNYVGELPAEDGSYHFDFDGQYDTSYGVAISCFQDLSENEQSAVLSAANRYEIEYALGIEFETVED